MKVYGQLEKAGLEQLTSDPAPAWPGRAYINTSTPTKSVPKIYNGSTWLQMLTGQTAALVSQTATYSATVDWSTGVNQQVVLNGPCSISFSNPQAGQVHNLVVTQGASSGLTPLWRFTLNMADQDSRRAPYQPIGCPQANESFVFSWFYSAGVRPAYATMPAQSPVPTSTPGTLCTGCDISSDGKEFVVSSSVSPFHYYYNLYDKGSRYSYGLKNLVTPTTAVAALVANAYSPDLDMVFGASGTTPFMQCFYLDRYTAAGTALANGGTLPAGAAQCLAVNPNGIVAGVGHTTTPFMTFYPFVGSGSASPGFGAKIANPVTLPAAQVNSAAFSPHGDFLAGAGQTTPFLQVWAFNNSLATPTFGAICTQPGILPAGGPAGAVGKGVAWRPQGDFIALAMTTTPFLYVVPFNRASATFGTALTIAAQPGSCTSVQWTPDGQYLLVGCSASPWLLVYDFSAGAIGSTVAFDGALSVTSTVNDISVTPDGSFALLSFAAGSLAAQALPNKTRNYLRIID